MNLEPVPMIVFAKGAWYALDALCDLGYNVISLDWLQDPANAVRIRGNRPIVFQGNADPGVLYGTREAITSVVEGMVTSFGGGKRGWIANLGHGEFRLAIDYVDLMFPGITPKVDPEQLRFFFEEIHRVAGN
jgi:uroporphyrinogen decarboxylase